MIILNNVRLFTLPVIYAYLYRYIIFLYIIYIISSTKIVYLGFSKYVLKPKTTEQVSEILKYCYKRGIAICVQGGNTGLVGGSVPVFDEVILSTSAMNKIISLNTLSGK